MSPVTDFADSFLGDVLADTEGFLETLSVSGISYILLAAFGITVGFVAYKLIKRALNKA